MKPVGRTKKGNWEKITRIRSNYSKMLEKGLGAAMSAELNTNKIVSN